MKERKDIEETYDIEVTYKYLLPQHRYDLKIANMAKELLSGLWNIHNECRTILKHGTRAGEGVEEFAERINAICIESGALEIE